MPFWCLIILCWRSWFGFLPWWGLWASSDGHKELRAWARHLQVMIVGLRQGPVDGQSPSAPKLGAWG